MVHTSAIDIDHVVFRYGDRVAVNDLCLRMPPGIIFALLGPNGGGKTTLFRLLSTLIPLQSGNISILGLNITENANAVRHAIGVVFQAPSLDKKLTVHENLRHQSRLYGLRPPIARQRENEMLHRLGIEDRVGHLVETLSGGLRRRVELAKGLLHNPRVLLLDEPSTGLDPGARSDLWDYLGQLRDEDGVTIMLTTHLLEEAERADRIGILHAANLVAEGTPHDLRATVGGNSITIETEDPDELASLITDRFDLQSRVLGTTVRLEQPDGHRWITQLVEAFPGKIQAVTLGKPTLEDVFIDRTGHRFWSDGEEDVQGREHD